MRQNEGAMSVTFKEEKQREVEKNFEFFQSVLPELLESHFGETALLRHQKIVAFFDTAQDAHTTGETFYEDGMFSIQKVDPRPIDLGIYSRF